MNRLPLSLLALVLTALPVACQSRPAEPARPTAQPGTPLDNHSIKVRGASEVLELHLDPAFPTLKRADLNKLERFIAAYRDRGHGPLRMVMPENGASPQLAVEAIKVARELAWEKGVAWDEISGSVYEADGRQAPILLTFDVYEAVAPDCRSMAAFDLSDISGNNELGNFGCSVRHNLAQMIADPADLLAERELDPRDSRRVSIIMEAYRQGQPTGATGGEENVSISNVGGGGGG
ncbi:MAG: hypothetical protein GVY06_07945 [Alphaproteobacteria bacterium]|nr:hypothetical protein [Alphaproteobacteria bacterium]